MNHDAHGEHALQTIFGLLQTGVVMGGTMLVAALMKAWGYPNPERAWHALPVFVRNWGFALVVLPLAWVIVTAVLERDRRSDFTRRWTLASGFFVLGGLGFFFALAVVRTNPWY